MQIERIAKGQAIRSVRRPSSAGFFDASVNKTFVAWLGEDSNSYVQAFDHETGAWTEPKQVTQIQTSSYFEGPDAHNYPSLIQAKDGRLMLFYVEHSSELRLAMSPQRSSLEGFWSDTIISEAPFAGYPFPVQVANGDVYVFYRESSYELDDALDLDDRPINYVVSKDNGASWQSSKEITGEAIALGSWDREDNLNEIYIGQMRYQPRLGLRSERIHMVWTIAGGGNEGVSHDRYHKGLYYAYFKPSNKHFYCAGNQDMGVSLGHVEMNNCLVEDTGELNADMPHAVNYIQLIHWTKGGKPLVVYHLETEEKEVTRAATWSGREWLYSDISEHGNLQDIEKYDQHRFVVYLVGGIIRTFVTEDAGLSWSPGDKLELPEAKRFGKVSLIREYHPQLRLLALETTKDLIPSSDVFIVGQKD